MITHEGQCIGFLPRQGCYYNWREILRRWRQFRSRMDETIGRFQLPPIISTGFLYVMDATGRRHILTMDMAHSFEVCSCVRSDMVFILHLLKFPAIYRSS